MLTHGTLLERLERSMPRAYVGANLLTRAMVRGLLAGGIVFESMQVCLCEFGQIYMHT